MGGNNKKKQQQRLAALLTSTLKDHPELFFEDSSELALFASSFPLRGPALPPPPPQPQHSTQASTVSDKPQGQEQSSSVAAVAAGPPSPPPIAFLGLRENDCPEVEEYLGPQTLIFTFHLPASLLVADIYVK